MSLFSRLRQAFAPEQRREGLGIGVFGFNAPGQTNMTAAMAENLSVVTAGVSLIASTIGSLPATIYKRQGTSRVEAPDHPVNRVLREPNEQQTWPDFCEWMVASVLLHGNGLALIDADNAGQARQLVPIPWGYVNPLLLPGSNRLAFDVLEFGPWGGTGLPSRVLDSEILHVRDRSDDGYLGRSRLSRAPQVLEAALGLQEFSSAIWRNAATPSGVIKHPAKLSRDTKEYLLDQFRQRYEGAHNAKRTLVLDEGMMFEATGLSPEDSEVLASRRFSTEDLARLLGVPPPLVGIWDHSSFTNSATAGQWMGTFTILPLVRKIEASFTRALFADPAAGFHLELDMTGLMRGDAQTQLTGNLAAVAAGVMTRDEARHDLGLNPLSNTDPGSEPPS